ncbi:substrate-binding domain-containing protein [Mesorhizobium sp. SP-1A]|uniref:substrate-binding domain-containing protein n=1 Tax=Mesorhizobium sp. SP-1A TaxID=3077840 RepID=UPI0028F6C777|nr:substrate-binding domain-containing protein [Mesorhizobium sp. SP-1A]
MHLSRRQFSVLMASLAAVSPSKLFAATGAELTAQAAKPVDTSKFKKAGPYKIGVACGWLSISWVVYAKQYILWAADQHKADVKSVVFTDAAFNPAKQISDIEDLMRQNVDAILYWAADDKALEEVLDRAVKAGIVTVNAFGSFVDKPGTVSNAVVDQWTLAETAAKAFAKDLNGKGKIAAIMTVAGSASASDQLDALKSVLAQNPGIELLNVSYADFNRAKAKQVAENLLQAYPDMNGVFCTSGNQALGVVEAIDEAGRLADFTVGPADELNGWAKWVVANKKGGSVPYSPIVGKVAFDLAIKILKGEPVPRGELIPIEYYSPADEDKIVRNDLPDDSWPGPLPAEFLPK